MYTHNSTMYVYCMSQSQCQYHTFLCTVQGSTTVGVADPSPAPQQQQQQQQQPPVLLQRNPSLLLEVGAVDLPQPLQSEEETLSVGTSLPNAAAQFDQTDSAQPAVAPMDPRNRLEVEQSSVHKLKVPTLSKQLTGSDLSSNNTSATGSEENLASGSNVSLEISDLPEGLKASSGDEHSKKVSTSSNPSSTVAKSSGEGGGGIGWWAEAMAETQDFDALIEKMDSENTNGNSNTDKQSLPESLDLDSPGQPAPPPQRLKQAKSDSSLSSPDAAVGGGERNLSHGHSETSVRRRSGSTGEPLGTCALAVHMLHVRTPCVCVCVAAGYCLKKVWVFLSTVGEFTECFTRKM